MNDIERLAVKTGAAVAFAAHYSKGNQAAKEAIDRVSGSGVFARDPDSLLMFTKHQEADCFTVEATLRNFPPLDPFVVRWEYPLFHRDSELDPTNLKTVRGKNETTPEEREARAQAKKQQTIEGNAKRICEFLAKYPKGETKQAISHSTGMNSATVTKAIEWLLGQQSIVPCVVRKGRKKKPEKAYKLAE